MTDASTLKSVLSDAELILATRAGDSDAYSELYVRHVDSARAAAASLTRSKADRDDVVAEAFSRVLSVLQRGGGPDVSFRPYLLTAVRNAFYDRTRKARREEATDDLEDSVNVSLLDAASSEDDKAMVAAAFASLPERWQLVLWHTEVEGRSPAEVAPLLGIAPNAVAALAYRAREGLRTAYLQSHLQKPLDTDCKECAANLAAYVRDGLSTRERRKVDEHLRTCESCKALLLELQDANTHLRAVLIPLIIGVPAAKYLGAAGLSKGVITNSVRVIKNTIRSAAVSSPAATGIIAAGVVTAMVAAGVAVGGGFNSDSPSAGRAPVESTVAFESGSSGPDLVLPPLRDAEAADDTATDDTTLTTDAEPPSTDPLDTATASGSQPGPVASLPNPTRGTPPTSSSVAQSGTGSTTPRNGTTSGTTPNTGGSNPPTSPPTSPPPGATTTSNPGPPPPPPPTTVAATTTTVGVSPNGPTTTSSTVPTGTTTTVPSATTTTSTVPSTTTTTSSTTTTTAPTTTTTTTAPTTTTTSPVTTTTSPVTTTTSPVTTTTSPVTTTTSPVTTTTSPVTTTTSPVTTTTSPVTTTTSPSTTTTSPSTTTTQPGTTTTQPGTTTTTQPGTTTTTQPGTTTTTQPGTTTTTQPGTTTTTIRPPGLPVLDIGASVVGNAYAGGDGVIEVNVANGFALGGGSSRMPEFGPALNMQVSVVLPAGVTFVRNDNAAWVCSTAGSVLTCKAPTLGDGLLASARVTLRIAANVTTFQLLFSVSADGVPPVTAKNPLLVTVSPLPSGGMAAIYDHGTVEAIGNSSMTCNELLKSTCTDARDGEGLYVFLNRQLYAMKNVQAQTQPDSDKVMPFNSSISKLDLGTSTVTKAYLMWSGDVRGDLGISSPDPNARNSVRFKTPAGGFTDVVASNLSNYGDGTQYTAYLDVTDLVQKGGSGNYQVSNIQAAQDLGTWGGWSLVIVTHNDADPLRLLTVMAPNASFDDHTNFRTSLALPGTTQRDVTMAVAAFEGELGLYPEHFRLNGNPVLSPTSPVNNPFNGSVQGAVSPTYVNNFGVDIDRFETKANGQLLTIQGTSESDYVRVGLIALAIDL